METYNLYIDESCHLQNDYSPSVMSIGYIKANTKDILKLKNDIKIIKKEHRTPFEYKWNKVSSSRISLYKELIDYFFENQLFFRCVIIKYKERLDHASYNQGDHSNFYYKMIYQLLHNKFTTPIDNNLYNIFLDIKDTRGREKIKKIKQVFDNEFQKNSPFIHFQHIRSYESELIQMADLFIGAVTFKTRGKYFEVNANRTKVALVDYLEKKSGYSLEESTEPWETKFNIFDHQPKQK